MCSRFIICGLILIQLTSVDSVSLEASMQISVIKSTICSCSYKSPIILSSTAPIEPLPVDSGPEVSYEEPLTKTTITTVLEVNHNSNTYVAYTSIKLDFSDETFITKTQTLSSNENRHSVVAASDVTELYANEFKRDATLSNKFVFTTTPSHVSFSSLRSTSLSSASGTGTPPLSVTPTSMLFSYEVQSLKEEREELIPSSLSNGTIMTTKTIFDEYKDKEVFISPASKILLSQKEITLNNDLKTSLIEASVSSFTDKKNGESEWSDQRFKGMEQEEEEEEQQQQQIREKEIMNNIMLGLGCGLTACIMLIATCICLWKYCCASVFSTSPTNCLNKVHPMLMHVVPPRTRKVTSGIVGGNSRYKKYRRRGRLTTFRMFQDV